VNWPCGALLGMGLCTGHLAHSCAAESAAMSTIAYVDSVEGFSLEVPAGWHVAPARYEVMHYSDAFLSVNNRIPGLLLPSWTSLTLKGERSFLWPDGWGKYLEPGTVYIMFTHEGGPGGWPPCYGASQKDTFHDALAKALEGSGRRTVGDISIQTVYFTKWTRTWLIVTWMREPCSVRDKEQAIELLKSLRLRETPIVSPQQAVGVAIHHLPTEEQPGPWPAVNARACARETKVQPDANGYSVEFILYMDDRTQQMRARWSYRVQQDGTVEEFPEDGPNSVLQPPAPRKEHR